MSFVGIMRFFFGYIEFKAKGGFSERFINLCTVEKINLWSLTNKDKTIHAFVSLNQYEKTTQIAQKSGMNVSKIQGHGLPFIAKKNKHRIGLLIGAIFFVVFSFVSSLFVWNIEIDQSQTVSTEKVLQSLEEIGFGVGSLKSKVDTEVLTREILFEYANELSWMAINLSGSYASIEIRDYVPLRDNSTYTQASNLVADFDGVLLSVDVYNGEKNCVVGSAVKAGEILISGAVQNSDFSLDYYQADGKITALHSTVIDKDYTYSSVAQTLNEEATIYSLCILGFEIPLGFYSNSEDCLEYNDYSFLSFDGVTLAFGMKKTVYASKSEAVFDEKYQVLETAHEFTFLCYDEHKSTTVLSEDIDFNISENKISVYSEFECIDFMGIDEIIEFF